MGLLLSVAVENKETIKKSAGRAAEVVFNIVDMAESVRRTRAERSRDQAIRDAASRIVDRSIMFVNGDTGHDGFKTTIAKAHGIGSKATALLTGAEINLLLATQGITDVAFDPEATKEASLVRAPYSQAMIHNPEGPTIVVSHSAAAAEALKASEASVTELIPAIQPSEELRLAA